MSASNGADGVGRAEKNGVARGYTRVSTDDQRRSGISLEVQEKQIKAYYDYQLAPAGYRWGGVYRDEAVSGWKLPFLRRPNGILLHEQLRRGDFIVFAKLDRGFRTRRDMDKTVHIWDDMGVGVRFLDLPVDTSGPFGKLMLAIVSAFAEWEAEVIRERNRAVAAYRKSHGMPMGKKQARLGFRWEGPPGQMVQVPKGKDREVIDRIMEWRIAGSEFDDIATHLQNLNLRTFEGREWTTRRVRDVFYRELKHLVNDGLILRSGGGPRKDPLVLRWVEEKLPKDRVRRLRELYHNLGRTINDTTEPECDAKPAEGLGGESPPPSSTG